MLSKEKILSLFESLNELLRKENEVGEVGLVGGAVMCLVYNARQSTKDIDAIFKPTQTIRRLVRAIAGQESLPEDWLNDAAKGFIVEGFNRVSILNLSHLRVWVPEPKYMLAMKCLSARWDSHDKMDVQILIEHLKFKKPEEVFRLIEGYYPKSRIPPKTQFFIEELFNRKKDRGKRRE